MQGEAGFGPENPTGNHLPANAFLPLGELRPVSRGDAIRALDHPYRQRVLKVLEKGRTTYSDLFTHLEPNGGDRGRFNYHLRSLRNADLVRLTDSLYGLTPRGEAALVLLRDVSEGSEARPRPERESRADVQGWVRRVGDALRSRAAEAYAVVPCGRVLLLVGSVLLLVSYFLPWFTVPSPILGIGDQYLGTSTRTYYGLDGIATLPLAFFGGGLSALLASVWLFLVVVFGVASAIGVRRFSWFGISGILLLALAAIQMFVAAKYGGITITSGTPSVGFAYGFILAVIGSASIEAGARLKTPATQGALMRTPLPFGILLIGLGIASLVGASALCPR